MKSTNDVSYWICHLIEVTFSLCIVGILILPALLWGLYQHPGNLPLLLCTCCYMCDWPVLIIVFPFFHKRHRTLSSVNTFFNLSTCKEVWLACWHIWSKTHAQLLVNNIQFFWLSHLTPHHLVPNLCEVQERVVGWSLISAVSAVDSAWVLLFLHWRNSGEEVAKWHRRFPDIFMLWCRFILQLFIKFCISHTVWELCKINILCPPPPVLL